MPMFSFSLGESFLGGASVPASRSPVREAQPEIQKAVVAAEEERRNFRRVNCLLIGDLLSLKVRRPWRDHNSEKKNGSGESLVRWGERPREPLVSFEVR